MTLFLGRLKCVVNQCISKSLESDPTSKSHNIGFIHDCNIANFICEDRIYPFIEITNTFRLLCRNISSLEIVRQQARTDDISEIYTISRYKYICVLGKRTTLAYLLLLRAWCLTPPLDTTASNMQRL